MTIELVGRTSDTRISTEDRFTMCKRVGDSDSPKRQVSFHESQAVTLAARSMRKDSIVLGGDDDPEMEGQTHSSAYFTSLSIENQETEGEDSSVQEKHISVMGK